MTSRPLPPPLWIRWGALLLGALLLLWLPVEDTTPRPALLLAAGLILLGALTYAHRQARDPCRHVFRRNLLIGALAGLALSPLAVFIMAFKSGLHGHGFPDYTSAQFSSILERTPLWILGGLLLGLGRALWRWSHCR